MLAPLLELNTKPPLMSAHPHLGIVLHLYLHNSGLNQRISPEKETEITQIVPKWKRQCYRDREVQPGRGEGEMAGSAEEAVHACTD